MPISRKKSMTKRKMPHRLFMLFYNFVNYWSIYLTLFTFRCCFVFFFFKSNVLFEAVPAHSIYVLFKLLIEVISAYSLKKFSKCFNAE